jgi:predicted HTH domain antitoxin
MPVSLEISDEVLSALKLPPRAIERELRKELAIHLVAEGLLPQGSACRLASMSRLAFDRLLGERQIPVRYTPADVEADVQALSAE